MDMKNIFENANFGDKFCTRDGRLAIYIGRPTKDVAHRLIIDGQMTYDCYNDYGRNWIEECDIDIVDRWKEPIDEEKLTNMANEYMLHPDRTIESYSLLAEMMEAFKAGYRKAKEEK